jgi:ACS family hexuronate transporter-like MFS transporter
VFETSYPVEIYYIHKADAVTMMYTGSYRWRILALLFFATTINYIDRQVIGILAPYISDELGWSEVDYGYIVTAFQVAYGIGLVTMGRLLDRIGTRIGYSLSIMVWSLAGMAHALARSVFGFGLARFTLGIGEAANFPAAVKTVAEWFPKKERAYATGWFNAGSTAGAITAPLIVPLFALQLGWRWAFIITGALGFIWLVFWWLYYQRPEVHPGLSRAEYGHIRQDGEDTAESTPWGRIFPLKATLGLAITRFISDWVWWFFLFWLPKFLNDAYGITLSRIGLPLIVIYVVSSAGGIAGGWLSSRMIRSGRSLDAARKTVILICGICALPVILAPVSSGLWIAVTLIALAASAHQAWAANMFSIISDVFPRNAVGSVTGLIGTAGAIGGALAATFVGYVREWTGSYMIVFIVAGSVYLLNWLIIKLFIPEITSIEFE